MTNRLSFLAASAAVVALLAGVGAAQAGDADQGFTAGSILVRARGLAVLPDVSSTVSAPVNGHVSISNDYIPELDGSYFFTPNFAVEAIAGVTRHAVTDKGSVVGDTSLGNVHLLPPTVTAQWHFFPTGRINPYVGGGLNYTFFFDPTNGSQHSGIKYDDGLGYALQAGVDVSLGGRWYANVDVKKIFLDTKVHLEAANVIPTSADVHIDPLLVGLGIGYRF